eukprot:521745-Alexandrium_andersonii.AAC.1
MPFGSAFARRRPGQRARRGHGLETRTPASALLLSSIFRRGVVERQPLDTHTTVRHGPMPVPVLNDCPPHIGDIGDHA